MKKEYDFSRGERGKFYSENVQLRIPIYLDPKLQASVEHLAVEEGKELEEMVNLLLRQQMETLEGGR